MTNLKKYDILIIQGKESQRSQNKNLKKLKKVLDKTKNLWYNKDTKGKQKQIKKKERGASL